MKMYTIHKKFKKIDAFFKICQLIADNPFPQL